MHILTFMKTCRHATVWHAGLAADDASGRSADGASTQARRSSSYPYPPVHSSRVADAATSKRVAAVDDRCQEHLVDPLSVATVQAGLPDEGTTHDLAETFRTLSDPGRVRLIMALLEAGELCVCDLAAATGLSQTACSHNLRLLRSRRLARYRKVGRNVYYSLDDDHIRQLLEVARDHVND